MTLAFFTGFAVGTFVAGIVSDMFGRKRFDFWFLKQQQIGWNSILWPDQPCTGVDVDDVQVDRPLLPSDGNERHLDLVHAPLCSFCLPLVVSVEIKLTSIPYMVFMSFFKACRDCCHRQLHSCLCLGRRTLHRWIAKRYINMKENEKLRKWKWLWYWKWTRREKREKTRTIFYLHLPCR